MNERWLPVRDYEGLYEVSDMGNVRSLPRNGTSRTGTVLKPAVDSNGYRRVVLAVYGVNKNCKVARLVALAFIPNPENKPEVNHIEGREKWNDAVSNLEWATKSENILHKFATGLQGDTPVGVKGAKHHMAKLTDAQVQQIRNLYKGRSKGPSQATIGRQFKVSQTMVGFIVRGANWTHLRKPPQTVTEVNSATSATEIGK